MAQQSHFHDEQQVRTAAIAALGRVVADDHLTLRDERIVLSPVCFTGADDFERRTTNLPTLTREITDALRVRTRAGWDSVATRLGQEFRCPMRLSPLVGEQLAARR